MAESSSPPPPHSPPPPEDAWRKAWQNFRPRSNPLIQRPINVSILRVNQLDAARLDTEMTGMLKEQLLRVFSFMQPGLLSRYEAELQAFLEFLIWRFSIWVDRPTPGNYLMNLRYRDEKAYQKLAANGEVRTGLEGPGLTKSQKMLYCIIVVGGRYIWTRLQTISIFERWGDGHRSSWVHRAWMALQRAEGFYRIACFCNFILFLHSGRFRSIIERVLNARLIYIKPNMNRAVSFEYMNRQLVWHEFSEVLLLLLPFLNALSMKKAFGLSLFGGQYPSMSIKEDSCPVCEKWPINVPYTALPCGHLYCYYCLSTRTSANRTFRCVRCNASILALRRHHPQKELKASGT